MRPPRAPLFNAVGMAAEVGHHSRNSDRLLLSRFLIGVVVVKF